MLSIEDFRTDGWPRLARQIARGQHPKKKHLASALRRGGEIPEVARNYIAGLIDGSIVRRGRPDKWKDDSKLALLAIDIESIRRMLKLDVQDGRLKLQENQTVVQIVFGTFARKHKVDVDTIEKYYRKGKRLLREQGIIRALIVSPTDD